jgi:hypothetical protein
VTGWETCTLLVWQVSERRESVRCDHAEIQFQKETETDEESCVQISAGRNSGGRGDDNDDGAASTISGISSRFASPSSPRV